MTSNDIELGLLQPQSGIENIEEKVFRMFERFIGEIYRVNDGGQVPATIVSFMKVMSGCRETRFSWLGVRQSLLTFDEGEYISQGP